MVNKTACKTKYKTYIQIIIYCNINLKKKNTINRTIMVTRENKIIYMMHVLSWLIYV